MFKNYKFKVLLLLVAISSMGINSIYSQQTSGINYQGVARRADGNPVVNQKISLRLSIKEGSASGASVYSEIRQVLTNQFGLFNVVVGSTGAQSQSGTLLGVSWATGSKYLQVEMDPQGGNNFITLGTSQLQSVPYAIYANSAAPIGTAAGDLSGSYPNPTVSKIQGKAISSTAPLSGQILQWNGTTWEPSSVVGVAGSQGPAGAIGPIGPQGPIGLTGSAGAQGIQGLTGAVGPQGLAGVDGLVGPAGPIGLTGATGAQGIQGLTGAIGPQGAVGPQGLAGVDGLVGPAGPIGLTGATGAQGIQGLTGATGPQGSIGLQGSAGVDGLVGPAGPIGLTGATGAQGIQGLTGAIGPQGLAGVDGLVGPAGPIGQTGATGAQGIPGLDGTTLPGATNASAGKIQLAGDLAGINSTAAEPRISISAITTDKIADLNVTDAKIASLAGSKLSGNIAGNAVNVTGTVAITNGGTGAINKTTAFDALSPMTTSGDIVYGGTSGTGTRLGKGNDGEVLKLSSGIPSWGNPFTGVGSIDFAGTGNRLNIWASDRFEMFSGSDILLNPGTDGNVYIDSYDAGSRVATKNYADTKAPINANLNDQTGTAYTLLATDNGKVITLNNGIAITLTVPTGLPAGFNCMIVQKGDGIVTIVPVDNTLTVTNRSGGTKTGGKNAIVSLIALSATYFISGGDMQ